MRRIAFVMVLTAALAGSSRADVFTFTNSAQFFAALGKTPSFTETYQGSPPNTPLSTGGTLIPQGSTFNGLIYNFSAPTFGGPGAQASGRIDGNVGNYVSYNGFGNPNAPNPALTIQTLAAFRTNPAFFNPNNPNGELPNSSVFYPGEFITVKTQSGQPLFAAGVFFNAEPT